MPRISAERREARRTEIVDAARRCFARNGFHQTSMPDLLAEAGVSAGGFYRYFTSKDEVILEIAAQAFGSLSGALGALLDHEPAPSLPAVLEALTTPLRTGTMGGSDADVDDYLRCALQAWAETLRNETLHARARSGFEAVRGRLTTALRAGQDAGRVPAGVAPADAARLIMAILPGLLLQRAVFGERDPDPVIKALIGLTGS